MRHRDDMSQYELPKIQDSDLVDENAFDAGGWKYSKSGWYRIKISKKV